MEGYMELAKVYWAKWDGTVSDTVFGVIQTAFGVDIRKTPCPHTVDLPAVRTPTILVTWAIVYLFIVGVGLVTITPVDKTKKVSQDPDGGSQSTRRGGQASLEEKFFCQVVVVAVAVAVVVWEGLLPFPLPCCVQTSD